MARTTPRPGLSRRRFLGSVLATTTGVLIAACSPTATPAPTSAPAQSGGTAPSQPTPAGAAKPTAAAQATPAAATQPGAKAPVEIRLATDWVEGARGETMDAAVPEFQKQHPEYSVKVEPIGGDYYDKLSVQIAGGTAADVMLFSGAFFLNFQEKGAFADITPHARALNVQLTDYTSVPKVFEAEGKQYGMPFQLTITTWYANVDMFEQAGVPIPQEGWNWDDMLTAATKLTIPDQQQYGIWMRNSAESIWGPFMLSAGGNWFNEEHTKTAFADGEGFEGFKYAVELITEHKVSPTPAESTALATAETSNLFVAGRVAMTPANSGFVGTLLNQVKDRFRWQPIPQPAYPKNGKVRTTFNDQPHVINARAKDVEGSVALAVFMSGEFVQGLIADFRGSTPVLRSLQNTDRYLKAPPENMQQILKNLEVSEDLDFTSNWLEWYRTFHQETDRAFIGEATPEEAFNRAIEEGDKILARR